MSRPSFSQTIR